MTGAKMPTLRRRVRRRTRPALPSRSILPTPHSDAARSSPAACALLPRGLLGNLGDRVVVASPLYKHHFDQATGERLEPLKLRVRVHALRVRSPPLAVIGASSRPAWQIERQQPVEAV